MTDKEKVISNVYNEFYGSINNTLKDAQKIDPTIKYQDVKQWFDRSFTRKTNLKGYNSFIANYPFQEFQMDLFFINDLEDQEFTTGLLVIDIFTKFITVVPLKSKLADDVLVGIKEAFSTMGKSPDVLYTDDEGSFHSKQAEQFYKEKSIEHLITRGHAPYAERAIRTIKAMIYKRIEKQPDAKWYSPEILSNALVTYNYKTKHDVTNMTPAEAKKPSNYFEVKTRLEMNRINKRRYPDISVNDTVRVYTKKKNFQKERVPVWSENKYKVIKIDRSHGQNFYYIEGRDKALMRHEILKVT